jgi:hypothetical protein
VRENEQIPIVLIHGAWLTARSWEDYSDHFAKRGFAVSAPEWPRKVGDVEEIRAGAEQSAGLGVQEVVQGIDSWLDGVLDAPIDLPAQSS